MVSVIVFPLLGDQDGKEKPHVYREEELVVDWVSWQLACRRPGARVEQLCGMV